TRDRKELWTHPAASSVRATASIGASRAISGSSVRPGNGATSPSWWSMTPARAPWARPAMADREDLDGGRHPGDPQDLRHQRRGITDGGPSAVLTLTPGDAGKEIHTHHTYEHHVGQVDHETV